MPTVTMRELKQNPQAVVREILETAESFRVTSHGHDTGVVMQPAGVREQPQRFVSGEVLNDRSWITGLTSEQAHAWKEDIAAGIAADDVVDPWGSA